MTVAAYAGACVFLWLKQRELIFEPSREVAQTPADLGLEYEDVSVPIPGSDDARLHGWWLDGKDALSLVVLYLHGNDLNIGANLNHLAALHRIGVAVLAPDYRGYGKSSAGPPFEARLYEDAEAARAYLVRERQIEPQRIIIHGHSLGAAIAVELALRHPEAAGLILESAFTSISEMARAKYWMFPVDWLLDQRFDNLAKMPQVQVPILLIHGTADTEVKAGMSKRLFQVAPGSKRLVLIPGGGHDDNPGAGGDLYERALREFITEVSTRPDGRGGKAPN